jgi:hypothetical protein
MDLLPLAGREVEKWEKRCFWTTRWQLALRNKALRGDRRSLCRKIEGGKELEAGDESER